jgi:hypothetical protein
MVILRKGTARWVFLTKQYALKLPRLRLYYAWKSKSWRSSLEGFHANLKERHKWQQSHSAHLCPILLSDHFGLFVVMRYARPLTDEEFVKLEYEYIIEGASPFGRIRSGDFKRENYGMLGNQCVKVDYET